MYGDMVIKKQENQKKREKAPRNYFQRFFNIESKYNYTVKHNNTETNFDNFPDLLLFLLILNGKPFSIERNIDMMMANNMLDMSANNMSNMMANMDSIDDITQTSHYKPIIPFSNSTGEITNQINEPTEEKNVEDNDKNTKIKINVPYNLDKFTISDGFNSQEFSNFEFLLQSLTCGEYNFNISETDIKKLTHIPKKRKISWLRNLF